MKINVWHDYRGSRTQNQVIEAGEYDAGDDRLWGLADYLVANGHAEFAGEAETELKTLDMLSRAELVDIAGTMGLEVAKSATKVQIIEQIYAAYDASVTGNVTSEADAAGIDPDNQL